MGFANAFDVVAGQTFVGSEAGHRTASIAKGTGSIRIKDGVFASFTTSSGLAGTPVRSLYEDKDGVLWIGSWDRWVDAPQRRKVYALHDQRGTDLLGSSANIL